jgi:TolA-binding protein
MAVLFLLLAILAIVALAAVGLENTDPSTATLFDRSFGQLTEGQLLIVAAGLGFLVALFLFLAVGASRTRRSRRKELRTRRRDAEGRVNELERENARLERELASAREEQDTVERSRVDAVAERDRAEAAVDRVRAGATTDRVQTHPPVDRTVATATGDHVRTDEPAHAAPPQPASVRRERLDDRTGTAPVPDEHAHAADEARPRR